MSKTRKSSRGSVGAYTIGRERFAKISAVEGIQTSRRVDEDFLEFDRKGLSPEERRRDILRKIWIKALTVEAAC